MVNGWESHLRPLFWKQSGNDFFFVQVGSTLLSFAAHVTTLCLGGFAHLCMHVESAIVAPHMSLKGL